MCACVKGQIDTHFHSVLGHDDEESCVDDSEILPQNSQEIARRACMCVWAGEGVERREREIYIRRERERRAKSEGPKMCNYTTSHVTGI